MTVSFYFIFTFFFFCTERESFTWKCSNLFPCTLHLLCRFEFRGFTECECQYLFTRNCVAGFSLAGDMDTLLSSRFFFLFFLFNSLSTFLFLLKLWSAIISPPQIHPSNPAEHLTHIHTFQTHKELVLLLISFPLQNEMGSLIRMSQNMHT